jgi:hypothetical protein
VAKIFTAIVTLLHQFANRLHLWRCSATYFLKKLIFPFPCSGTVFASHESPPGCGASMRRRTACFAY